MIHFLQHLLKLWFILMVCAFAAYLLIFNQETVHVNLPGIGEFKVLAAVAYITCFALGASLIAIYFATDVFKKSWELRRCYKRIRRLEADLVNAGVPVGVKKKGWFGAKPDAATPASDSFTPTTPRSPSVID